MKMKQLLFSLLIGSTVLVLIMNSCKKDEPTPLTLKTIVAGSVDLNAATAPTGVPVNTSITVTFSTDVDAATATATNIILTRDYDDAVITMDIQVSGNTITLLPDEYLGTGTLYVLELGEGLLSTEGEALAMVTRSFTTEGTFAPSGAIAYFTFENNANDVVGDFDPDAADVVDITYVASHNTAAGQAASFNGSTSLVEIPSGDQLMNTHDFTLSFWVKTNSADKENGHFVMGLAGWFGFQFEIFGAYDGCKLAAQYDLGDGTSASEDLWFNGGSTGTTKDNGGWQGWTFCKDLTGSGGVEGLLKDKWAHVVCVYNSASKIGTMYINGEMMKSQDFNLWPDGDAKKGVVGLKYNGDASGNQLALGFIQGSDNRTISDSWADPADPANNHFKGALDDIIVYHKVVTDAEILLMYNSGKP
jgi:hypothetical protein